MLDPLLVAVRQELTIALIGHHSWLTYAPRKNGLGIDIDFGHHRVHLFGCTAGLWYVLDPRGLWYEICHSADDALTQAAIWATSG